VAEDVVGGGGLFDEPGLELGEFLHPGDGLGDGPDLLKRNMLVSAFSWIVSSFSELCCLPG
jgi:hypothetical protein